MFEGDANTMPYHTERDTHLCEYCCQQHDKEEEIDFDYWDEMRKEAKEDEEDFITSADRGGMARPPFLKTC